MFSSNTTTNKFLILLFGPTAVGKTDLLLQLFRDRGEIINTDSMQVYRGLDIGTAKPSPGYLQKLPHHLIDIRDITEPFSAGDYIRLTEQHIPEIFAKEKIPVLSGGTAFYFRSFLMGLPEIPAVDPQIRKNLNALVEKEGLSDLLNELKKDDPVTFKRIDKNNPARVVRAVEVLRGTGTPLSSYKINNTVRNDYTMSLIGLERDRDELYKRINRRVEIMFEQGLSGELEELKKAGFTGKEPGLRGIGYSEYFQMIKEGSWDLEKLKELIKRNSRRYAKRQITFFKSLPGVTWLDAKKKITLNDVTP